MALSNVTSQLLDDFLSIFNLQTTSIQIFDLPKLPRFVSFILFFIIADFVQYFTHRLIHNFPFLWKFHRVHHSAKQMGFATHFRYHWMEPIIYKSIQYIPIILIFGFKLEDLYFVHFVTIAIGHLNHANLGWDYGIFKYIFNNPKMHTWHHAKEIPNKKGVNFAISLSLWDYLFNTIYIPFNGRDIELGFENDHDYPQNFLDQEKF